MDITKDLLQTAPDGKIYQYNYDWLPDNVTIVDVHETDAELQYRIQPNSLVQQYQLVTYNGFCKTVNPINTQIVNAPKLEFSKEKIKICDPNGGDAYFNISLENADQVLNWTIDNGNEPSDMITEIEKNKRYKVSIPKGYEKIETPFSFTINNSEANCPSQTFSNSFYLTKDILLKNVNLMLNNTNYINSKSAITAGQKVKILPNIDFSENIENFKFSWTPNAMLSASNTLTPTFISDTSIVFLLNISDFQGCERLISIPIKVSDIPNSSIYQRNIPNAFSPNGDGKNDYFYITGYGIKLVKSLAIFNRVGQQIFLSTNTIPNDQLKGWNGKTKNGVEAAVGTYVYLAEIETIDGKYLQLKGTITLIK